MIALIIIILCAAMFLVSVLFLSIFFVYPRIDYEKLPVGDGAKADDFSIHSSRGHPYLLEGDLPYPTDFEKCSNEMQNLKGVAWLIFDPDNVGEIEGWFNQKEPDDSWQKVNIPSTYNSAKGKKTSYEGYTWYLISFRDKLKITDGYFYRLCCRGILLRSKLWLNGNLIGEREGGYTPFYYDISDYINNRGENILLIRSDNRSTYSSLPPKIRDDHNPGWHMYGGIYRDIFIEKVPENYIFKATVDTLEAGPDSEISLVVMTHHLNKSENCTINYSIKGPDGKIVCKEKWIIQASNDPIGCQIKRILIKKAKLWSPEHPDLYTITLNLKSKSSKQELHFKTGIRSIDVKGYDILLNGKKIFLRGICKHEDDPESGASQNERIIRRDLNLIKKMNANYIRLAHYPHHQAELIAARDMGFLLSEEIAVYQAGIGFTAWFQEKKGILDFPFRAFGMKQMNDKKFLLNAQRELIEMIERDRNNPAIIMWSVGNECYTLFKDGGGVFGWLKDVAKAFDSTRPVTMAEVSYDIPLFDNKRNAMKHMDIISFNSYYGWYYSETTKLINHLQSIHRRFPDKPIILSEFGADAAPGRSDADGVWKAERVDYGKTYSEDYQKKVISDYWDTIKDKEYVTGFSPWVFSDFYNTWFPNNPVPNYNLKGITSKERKPKKSYYKLREIYSTIAKNGKDE